MKAHNNAFCSQCGKKMDGDEYSCPYCGFKLTELPPIETSTNALVDVQSNNSTLDSIEDIKSDSLSDNSNFKEQKSIEDKAGNNAEIVQNEGAIEQKDEKNKIFLIIPLAIIALILLCCGVGSFLIYNGTIPRNKVEFIPSVLLNKLSPEVKVAPAKVKAYYLTYSFVLVKNKKVALISSIMEPAFPEKSSVHGAEKSFLEFSRIRYSKDYFLFTKNMKTKRFDNLNSALDERENLKKDFKKQGYELRLIEVKY